MAHKNLFASSPKAKKPDATNEAGGRAYAFSAEHALAQYAVTGTFNTTFYATDTDQLDKVLELAGQVSTEFIAKTAVYTRQSGFMKDMPAFLAAYLASKDVRALAAIFPKVIDSGKMLRNFVQIVRSGVTGRKSLGSAPKRLVQGWFSSRSPENVFRQSLGSDPSMADVIKLARPAPSDAARRALYGWMIGKEVAPADLPPLVQAFEAYKKGETAILPDVPFEMLTALPLSGAAWKQLAKGMSWTQLRMNLNTLARHDVLADAAMVKWVSSTLADETKVRRARAFPYQLLAAFKAVGASVPGEIGIALQKAMEVSIENVPAIGGKVYVCPDISGSMHSPVTGHRKGATSSVRCIDVAALVAAAFLRKNPSAEVIPFHTEVVTLDKRLNPLDSVMTNAERLASLPSGGTACSAPLRHLNAQGKRGDLVVVVSDNMSWSDFGNGHRAGRGGTAMAEEWARFLSKNPKAKLVLIDLQPYSSTQVGDDPAVLNVGGFSDRVFEIVALFAEGKLGAGHWVQEIQRVEV